MNVESIQSPKYPVTFTTFPKPTAADRIAAKADQFQKGLGRWIAPTCQHLQEGDVHYYGVPIDQLSQTGNGRPMSIADTRKIFQELKLHILQNMGLPPNTPIIQVVSDSVVFSRDESEKAKEFLRKHIPDNAVVLYEYTGLSDAEGTFNTPAAFTDIVRERGMMDRTVVSGVSSDTPMGRKWPEELKHYVIVHGDAHFGDDITASDFMADALVMLGGGIQAFRHACNALLLNQKITAATGIIPKSDAYCTERDIDFAWAFGAVYNFIETPFFDAVKFLQQIQSVIDTSRSKFKKEPIYDLQNFYVGYFGRERCYLKATSLSIHFKIMPDDGTNMPRMDHAWEFFMKEKLYEKIEKLVTFGDL